MGEKNKKNKSKKEELEIATQEILWEENKLDEDTKKSLKNNEEKHQE